MSHFISQSLFLLVFVFLHICEWMAEEYERHVSGARAVGEGVYRIVRHRKGSGKRSHTHLIYKLEFAGEAQELVNIEGEGSFIIQIRNPEKAGGDASFSGLQNKRKAVFPAHLQGQLGHVKFGAADPPDFLNYEGCEFLLISASDHIEQELGLDLHTDPSCSDLLNTFGDAAPTSPLLKATWL